MHSHQVQGRASALRVIWPTLKLAALPRDCLHSWSLISSVHPSPSGTQVMTQPTLSLAPLLQDSLDSWGLISALLHFKPSRQARLL